MFRNMHDFCSKSCYAGAYCKDDDKGSENSLLFGCEWHSKVTVLLLGFIPT